MPADRNIMKTHLRFRIFRIYFGITANPILGDGQSVAFRIYVTTAILISYSCWVGEVVEMVRNMGSIEEVLECARMTIPLTAGLWIDVFMRYIHLLATYSKI
jgi:hypothetical protein